MAGADDPPPRSIDTWAPDLGDGGVRPSVDTWAPDLPEGARPPRAEAPPAPEPEPEPLRYGPGTLLGRGGIAEVHAARDDRLGREVALKRLRHVGNRTSRRRFLREARITAQLEHPNIVPVHDAGVAPDGTPFYTMKYVRGTALSEALVGADLDARLALLPRFVAVCQAMAYAHDRRVIHRDLKPDNLMLGEFGEALVVDWGLARALDEPEEDTEEAPRPLDIDHAALTVVGQVSGTPAYMAPEQARGQSTDLTTDVYALGAILYELLTGSPPHGLHADVAEQLAHARDGRFPPVRERTPEAPAELAAIAERALAVDPADRYPDAAAFLDELQRFIDGRMVEAYRYTPTEQALRLLRRYRVPLGLVGVGLVASLVVGTIGFVNVQAQRDQARANADRARASEALATEREAEARQQLASSLAVLGQAALDAGNLARARALGVASLLQAESPEARGLVAATWSVPHFVAGPRVPTPHPCEKVEAWGEWMVCVGEDRATVLAADGTELWGRPLQARRPHVGVGPDHLLVPHAEGVDVYGRDGETVQRFEVPSDRAMAVSGQQAVWLAPPNSLVRATIGEPDVEQSPQHGGLALPVWRPGASDPDLIFVSGRILWADGPKPHVERVLSAATVFRDQLLVAGANQFLVSDDATVETLGLDLGSAQTLQTDGHRVAVLGVDGGQRVFDPDRGQVLLELPARERLLGLLVADDTLWTADPGGLTRWSWVAPDPSAAGSAPDTLPIAFDASDDGQRMLRCRYDGRVEELGPNREVLREWQGPTRPRDCHYVGGEPVVESGATAARLGPDGEVTTTTLPGPGAMALQLDGRLVDGQELGSRVYVLEVGARSVLVTDRHELWEVVADGDEPLRTRWRRNVDDVMWAEHGGMALRMDPNSGDAVVESTEAGAPIARLQGHAARVYSAQGLPGDRLVTGAWDHEMRVWQLPEGRTLAILRGHEGRISVLGYHPATGMLHSNAFDSTYRTWDLSTLDRSPEALAAELRERERLDVSGGEVRRLP